MEQIIKREIDVIVQAIHDAAELHLKPEVHFEFGSDIEPDAHGHTHEIARAVESYFPSEDLHAIVKIDNHPSSLTVAVTLLPFYKVDTREGRWFVDSTSDDCWYFETSDKVSASELADYFNSSPHAQNLFGHKEHIGMDEDALKLWLLGLNTQGIKVETLAHKGTGKYERGNLLIK